MMNAAEPYRLNHGFKYGPVSQTISPTALPVEIIKGKSAYDIAVEEGFVGTEDEWLQSLKSDGGYVWEQTTPAATWTILHNLGRTPDVTVYIDGTQVFTDVFASSTQAVIVFASPTSGKALLI